jgi:hypothetical protein
MIPLRKLLITQEELRHTSQIERMTEFVRNGGFWTLQAMNLWHVSATDKPSTRAPRLIQITQFPDENMVVQDGHHRCTSTFLGGREDLRHDEYEIQQWQYHEYEEIALQNSWITPFNPVTEVRVSDLMPFKMEATKVLALKGDAAMVEYIRANKHQYARPRKLRGVEELASSLLRATAIA